MEGANAKLPPNIHVSAPERCLNPSSVAKIIILSSN